MSIEIKQLQIKSSVVQRRADGESDESQAEQTQALKEDILAECKTMIRDALNDLQER